MTATLSKTQAELPRLVEIASQGEDVIITVGGQPKAVLTRANTPSGSSLSDNSTRDVEVRVKELALLRDKFRGNSAGRTVDQILGEARSERT